MLVISGLPYVNYVNIWTNENGFGGNIDYLPLESEESKSFAEELQILIGSIVKQQGYDTLQDLNFVKKLFVEKYPELSLTFTYK